MDWSMQNELTHHGTFWKLWGLYQLTHLLSAVFKGFCWALTSSGNVPLTSLLFCRVYASIW